MKILDVLQESVAYGPPGSRAMGMGNFGALTNFYGKPKLRTSEKLTLNFGNNNTVDLAADDVDRLADYYNKLPDIQAKRAFVLGPMAMYSEFINLGRQLNLSSIPPEPTNVQPELPFDRQGSLFEKDGSVDRNKVRSSELSVLLKRAYARYPQAQSDVEALLLYDLDQQKNTDQNFNRQDKTNQRQDDVMRQLSDLTKRQSQQIAALDDENDELSNELDRIEAEIPAMSAQVAAQTGDKPAAPSASREASKRDREAAKARRQAAKDADKAEKDAEKAADKDSKKAEPAKKKAALKKKAVVRPRRSSAQVAADKAAAAWAKQQEKDTGTSSAAKTAEPSAAASPQASLPGFEPGKNVIPFTKTSHMYTGANPIEVPTEIPSSGDVEAAADQDDMDLPSSMQRAAESKDDDKKIAGRYDPDDFDQLVLRLRQKAKEQERRYGPVDIGQLAKRLHNIERGSDKSGS